VVYHAMILNDVDRNVVMGSLTSPSYISKVDVRQTDHETEVKRGSVQGLRSGQSLGREIARRPALITTTCRSHGRQQTGSMHVFRHPGPKRYLSEVLLPY
jgi:hypothetical protein